MRRAALLAPLALVVGCGSSGPDPATVKDALEARLIAKSLSFDWVVCVHTTRSFDGRPIFRCNVNFGEPHIIRYCATLKDGKLVTNREQPSMRCGRST